MTEAGRDDSADPSAEQRGDAPDFVRPSWDGPDWSDSDRRQPAWSGPGPEAPDAPPEQASVADDSAPGGTVLGQVEVVPTRTADHDHRPTADHDHRPIAAPRPAQLPPDRSERVITVLGVIIVVLMVLTNVAVVTSLIRSRGDDEPTKGPGGPLHPPILTDPIALELRHQAMRCVEGRPAEPKIFVCLSEPGSTHAEIRYLVEGGRMTELRIYHKAETADDRRTLSRRLQVLARGGPSIDDVNKVEQGMRRTQKSKAMMRVIADWGVFEVQYVEPLVAFQIDGRQDGAEPQRVPGPPFAAPEDDLRSTLGADGFTCTSHSYELSCRTAGTTIDLYRATTAGAYDYLAVSGRPVVQGQRPADEAVKKILPALVGPSAERLADVISWRGGETFFMEAAEGYLIRIQTGSIMIEPVSW